jgi:hypothetical protein
MPEDILTITILENGDIKTETPKISIANHSKADGFFAVLRGLCGGLQSRKARVAGVSVHSHGSVSHSH